MLRLISLVGVDEKTNIRDLIDLVSWYDKVSRTAFTDLEFGFLYSETRSKTDDDRYPSYEFIKNTKRILEDKNILTSIHLCGSEAVKDYLDSKDYILDLIGSGRVQLNFNMNNYNTETLIPQLIEASHAHIGQLILQINKSKKKLIKEIYNHAVVSKTIHFLHDSSGGFGKEIEKVEAPDRVIFTGYAGGLKPENIKNVLRLIESVSAPGLDFYIDMESGIRTDNLFDLEKIKSVIEETVYFYNENKNLFQWNLHYSK